MSSTGPDVTAAGVRWSSDLIRYAASASSRPASTPERRPGIRERQAQVRTVLRGLVERGQAAGPLRADLSPEDLIVAAWLLSRPLPGTGDWERLARRQIDLMISGLGHAAASAKRRQRS